MSLIELMGATESVRVQRPFQGQNADDVGVSGIVLEDPKLLLRAGPVSRGRKELRMNLKSDVLAVLNFRSNCEFGGLDPLELRR